MQKTKREILSDILNGKMNVNKISEMNYPSITIIELLDNKEDNNRPVRIVLQRNDGESMNAWLPYSEIGAVKKLSSNIQERGNIVFKEVEQERELLPNDKEEIEIMDGVFIPRWNGLFVADAIGGSILFDL